MRHSQNLLTAFLWIACCVQAFKLYETAGYPNPTVVSYIVSITALVGFVWVMKYSPHNPQ